MDLANFNHIKHTDEIKFVITDRMDYEWSKEIIRKYNLINKCHLLLSPVHGIIAPGKIAQWMLEDKLEARLNLQIHKYIQGSDTSFLK